MIEEIVISGYPKRYAVINKGKIVLITHSLKLAEKTLKSLNNIANITSKIRF